MIRALVRHQNVRRMLQSRYLSFHFQETRRLRLRIAADEIVMERFNYKLNFIGCYLLLTDSLVYTASIHLSMHFLAASHFSLPFSLSYYILRFLRIFDDGSFVLIHFVVSYLIFISFPSASILFSFIFMFLSSIISVFIHHSALSHFRRQFCKFRGIFSLRRL